LKKKDKIEVRQREQNQKTKRACWEENENLMSQKAVSKISNKSRRKFFPVLNRCLMQTNKKSKYDCDENTNNDWSFLLR
jgi:hypothetical protein